MTTEMLYMHDLYFFLNPIVVTELDGLRNNPPPLGSAASDALLFLENVLPPSSKRAGPGAANKLRNVRIQTSHNNFLPDITIRSEHFGFGEMDKNLDDLVLGACLWWEEQKKSALSGLPSKKTGEDEDETLSDGQARAAKVCLVTGDRNLRVKARARGVEVVGVRGVKRLVRR
ncbi:hypothetical protein BC938DRAFT_477798 [Jimgerdemannia flammicorona]|uniref:PIN domain-containing protein n=1 Tax=Jimgerdemannia flammicorona TaxID=994334 RepID=A0A433P7P5_9FUNG|nr:hypothetical protein BC938DRAFT_477798 [Jimgerdemannia flammicorona]